MKKFLLFLTFLLALAAVGLLHEWRYIDLGLPRAGIEKPDFSQWTTTVSTKNEKQPIEKPRPKREKREKKPLFKQNGHAWRVASEQEKWQACYNFLVSIKKGGKNEAKKLMRAIDGFFQDAKVRDEKVAEAASACLIDLDRK